MAFAGKLDRVAEDLGKPAAELTAALVGAGLQIPDKTREKPVFVEHAGEIFWLNKNAKDELWLNVSNAGVRAVTLKVLDLAAAKGCDFVEPDNVQGA